MRPPGPERLLSFLLFTLLTVSHTVHSLQVLCEAAAFDLLRVLHCFALCAWNAFEIMSPIVSENVFVWSWRTLVPWSLTFPRHI